MVKLFKAERGSGEIIKLVSILDKDPKWHAASSSWSFLEVARALRKDRKTRERIELDLRELRSHKISFLPVTDRIISEAESLVASTNTYAADAVHVSTYRDIARRLHLDGFLCDDTLRTVQAPGPRENDRRYQKCKLIRPLRDGDGWLMSEGESLDQPKPMTEEQIRRSAVGLTQKQLSGKVVLVGYDPAWPRLFVRESERICSALGRNALAIEHVGSTSVQGLAAKPIIDILLVVADSADESFYAPALEEAGYILGIREPEWHEHRMFKGPDTNINLHVFSQGDEEIERMLIFRDWLRENSTDRDIYLATKRELAQQSWKYVQNYADAKSKVVESIIAKARTSR